MKLRLMGLRCTHLVSTKKGDIDFFGRARQIPKATASDSTNNPENVELDEDGWQRWPDIEFEDAARQEREDDMAALEQLSQEYEKGRPPDETFYNPDGIPSDYRRYGNGFAWRSVLEEEARIEEQNSPDRKPPERWSCPICSIPQVADEKSFNEHMDGCLSRQTIKEIVKEPPPAEFALHPLMQATTAKRKRGRPRSGGEVEKKVRKSFFS